MAWRSFRFLLVTSSMLIIQGLLCIEFCNGGNIGVCYGRKADDLPTPDKVAQLAMLHKIKHLRIYDSNIQVIKAFANTGIELMIGIPNSDLSSFSQSQSNADNWLKNTVLPYYPITKIAYITVGAESPNDFSFLVVPAMQNVYASLRNANLQRKIKVSTTLSLTILSRSFPPSAGAFNSTFAFFLKPLLEFLADHRSPFMADIYPYYAYTDSRTNVSLDYVLFHSSSEIIDPNTGFLYNNMLDAQIDALYFALAALNFKTISIFVTETGWPSKGSRAVATSQNAEAYNANLVRRVLNGSGTPARPRSDLDVYIFSLFNEDRRSGPEFERNWGLFYPDQTSVYSLDFSKGGFDTTKLGDMNQSWCVAASRSSSKELQRALDWACSSGNVDCSAIQPSHPCYKPNTLASHASYALNSYYQKHGATGVACNFGGTGIRVHKDPSYDDCLYMARGRHNSATMNVSRRVSSATPIIAKLICTCLQITLTFGFLSMGEHF